MTSHAPTRETTWRGWAAAGVVAIMVTALVLVVSLATNTSPGTANGGLAAPTTENWTTVPSTVVSPTTQPGAGPSRTVMIFPDDEIVEGETSRTVAVDVAGSWPLGACGPVDVDQDRVDFVSGTERGPEYARDLAMGWYVDEAAADRAYTGLRTRIEGCASTTGATVETAASGLGTAGVLATVAQPSIGGWSEVSIYALSRLGGVVALAVDHASFSDATVPGPAEATITRAHAERLLAEVCRVEPARC